MRQDKRETHCFHDKKIAFGLTNSFYTFKKVINEMKHIRNLGGEIIPIMPKDTFYTNSKYYKSIDFRRDIEQIADRKIIISEEEAEDIESDILLVCPCSGNYIAKLSASIYDTSVLVSIKSHLKENKPILLGITAKDGLSTNAENIGKLLNSKNMFFVPFGQDNPITKPTSLSFWPGLIIKSTEYALKHEQIQPLLL